MEKKLLKAVKATDITEGIMDNHGDIISEYFIDLICKQNDIEKNILNVSKILRIYYKSQIQN